MKYIHYITAIAFVLVLAACSKDDPKPDGPTDTTIEAERKALMASTNFCVQQNGKTIFEFDEKMQQLQLIPAKNSFKIISDNGGSHIEFLLTAMPTNTTSAIGLLLSYSNNNKVSTSMKKTILLQTKNEMLYFWDDDTHTGIILPQIALE